MAARVRQARDSQGLEQGQEGLEARGRSHHLDLRPRRSRHRSGSEERVECERGGRALG